MKHKKRIFAVAVWALLLLGILPAHGKSMAALWLTMPDSVTPSLDASGRKAMADASSMQPNHNISNALDGESSIDTLTSGYLHATLSSSYEVALRRLPYDSGDSIVCLVSTWGGEAGESQVSFYNQDWQPLPGKHLPDVLRKDFLKQFLNTESGLSAERRDSLLSLLDPLMCSARLSATDDGIVLRLSTALLSQSAEKSIAPFLRSVTLKWDGHEFKF